MRRRDDRLARTQRALRWERLNLTHIEYGPVQPSAGERIEQCRILANPAARRIDQHCVWPHPRQPLSIDEMARHRQERHRQAHHVDTDEHLVKW